MKTAASAGIRLVFETDTENLQLGVSISPGSKSKGFILDVYANDALAGSIATWPDGGLEGKYKESYALGTGVKTVRIYLPWHACARIAELSVDDGAYIKPAAQHIGGYIFIKDLLAIHQLDQRDPQRLSQRLQQRNIRQSFGCLPLGDRFSADAYFV